MKNYFDETNPPKILIIRFSSIGDILLTTPVIRLLKKRYPESQIDFVVKKKFAQLLRFHPSINKLHIFEKDAQNLKQIKINIKNEGYDFIVDLHKNFRSYYLTQGSCTKKIVRYKKFIIKRFLYVHFKINLFKRIIPIYERYLLALTDFQIQYDNQGLDIFIDDQTNERIRSVYNEFLTLTKSPIIGIAPGASFATKRWTKEGFEQVVHFFNQKKNFRVILFGDATDRELIESYNIKQTQTVVNAAGELNLLETAALMDHCNVLLTNDSGLMHMATALKKKVVAIFGSTTELLGFYPYLTEHIILEHKSLACRPCSHVGKHKCPKRHFKCMKEIEAEQVIQAVQNMLRT